MACKKSFYKCLLKLPGSYKKMMKKRLREILRCRTTLSLTTKFNVVDGTANDEDLLQSGEDAIN